MSCPCVLLRHGGGGAEADTALNRSVIQPGLRSYLQPKLALGA